MGRSPDTGQSESSPSARWRGWLITAVAGVLMAVCFTAMAVVRDLRAHIPTFLMWYGVAYLAYGVAVWWMIRRPRAWGTLPIILCAAVAFRIVVLFATPPTLSDDVYRYIWDGRVSGAGVNPYAHAVNSPDLDWLDSPQRGLVNNDWMASPYLPVAQVLSAAVYCVVPDSPLAFQVIAVVLDLLTGWVIVDLLGRVSLPRALGLVYLWNPLVVVEFAHGAHVVDALMLCLVMLALWTLVARRLRVISAIALAAATLTKGLPVLLMPLLVRRWRFGPTLLYGSLVFAACAVFALGAGWGLAGPLDGEGVFGALRIYGAHWNYNGGVYHWLEVLLSGYPTPGAVPPEVVTWRPIAITKGIVGVALLVVLAAVWIRGRRCGDDGSLLKLAVVPLGAYLILATTVHPWYVTLVLPFLPFLAGPEGRARANRHLLPWLYLAAAVSLSYLTYLDPANLREYDTVRLLEYIPFYLLLIWSVWPASVPVGGAEKGPT
jgi:alpha-1,6-mannosyltransferase